MSSLSLLVAGCLCLEVSHFYAERRLDISRNTANIKSKINKSLLGNGNFLGLLDYPAPEAFIV